MMAKAAIPIMKPISWYMVVSDWLRVEESNLPNRLMRTCWNHSSPTRIMMKERDSTAGST